jgi:ABC-2 type transport system permease protein
MKTLLKYLRIYRAFIKTSFIADLQFRANFVVRLVTDILWYAAQIVTFEVLYLHTQKIGDWNVEQTRVFLGVMFVTDALYMVTLHDNLDGFSERVRKGDLDLLLAKPINSQFMLSLNRVATSLFGNLMIAISWLIYALYSYSDFTWSRLPWMLLMIPSGMICFYSIRFVVSASAVIFTKSDNLVYLWYQFYRLGLRPDSIYVPWLRFILMTILPVAMISSVPARFLIQEPDWKLFIWAIVLAAGLIYATHRFWNFALKSYSSASS